MKKNLILLLALLILGVFFFWDRQRDEQKKEREEKEKQLFSLKKDDVKEITIVKKDGTYKAVKEGERWKLVQPFETDGDKAAWDNIASSYTTGKLQRVVEENAANLEPFGLKTPAISVSLAGIGGATKETLLMGDQTPTQGKYFALIEGGSDVLTVMSSIYSMVDKSQYDFRDKTIVDIETDKVQKLDVAISGASMTLERKGDKEWVVTNPIQARADETQINDMLTAVKNGQIKQFIEENPADVTAYGLVNPATKLVFWTGEKGNQSSWAAHALLIGGTSAAEQLYAKREGQKNVFAVAPNDFNKVPKDVDSLRMKKISALKSWEISSVKLTVGGTTIAEATKDAGDWYLIQPTPGKANFTEVSNFTRSIADLQVAGFVQGTTEELGLGQPDVVIEIAKEASSNANAGGATPPAEKVVETIQLVKQKGNTPLVYYGARLDPLEIYSLKLSDVDAMIEKAKGLKLQPAPAPGTPAEGAPAAPGVAPNSIPVVAPDALNAIPTVIPNAPVAAPNLIPTAVPEAPTAVPTVVPAEQVAPATDAK